MAIRLQLRRGSTAENDAFTGETGEVTVDTTAGTLRVHDGTTAGGTTVVTTAASQTLANKTLSSPTFSGTITGSLLPSANVTYDLGSSTAAWNNLYLAGNTIFLGTATISYSEGSGFQFLDDNGNTATIALTTDDLTEGTNQYYTVARANSAIDNRVTQTFVNALNVDADLLDGANGTFYLDFTNFTNVPDPNIEVTLTGDVTGSGNTTLTNLTNGSISITAELSDTGVTANTYGSASLVPVITVDVDGRITNVSTVSVAGVSNFSYDTANGVITIDTADGGSYDATITLDPFTTTDLTEGTNLYYTTARANTDIDARVTKSFVEGLNIDLNTTGVVANTYGSASLIPVITVDDDGRLTNVSTVSVAGVSDFTYDSANGTLTIDTADGSSYSANIDLNAFTTTDLSEGTNQYYTVARANSAIDARVTQSFVNALNITAAGVQANSVTLGADTTGDYVESITGGTGVTVTGGSGEGSTPSIAIGQDVSTSANVTFQDGTFTGDLQIDGDFTVSGNVVSVNVQELSVEDNLIYLNANAATANPDLGWAGGYNDGTYAHAGIFRDASDGIFKIFDSYTPEPDASAYIDTTHPSFALADIQANNFIGDLSGNANTASALATSRTIALSGDVSGSVSFDGSANVTINATVSDNSHNHTVSTITDFDSAVNTSIYTTVDKTFVDALNVDADTLDGNDSTYFTNASNLASGTVPTARLGTGTANSTTYLAGDNTWQTLQSGVTITDDTSTNATRYISFTDQTSGTETTFNTSSTKLTYNPSTGTVSATDFNATSDRNLKENITTISDASGKVASLRGVNYNWKDSGNYAMGVIAQEVEEIIPEVVATNAEGQKSVNYQAMVGVLIEAVKDLQKQVNDLKG